MYNMNIADIFDPEIVAKTNPVITDDQPPYMSSLEKVSGKPANSIKVELDEKKRKVHNDMMAKPPSKMETDNFDELVNKVAYKELKDEYKNGGESEEDESDDEIYDDLAGVNTDFQDPMAAEFSMFTPEEQELADQINLDADSINAETPAEDPNDIAPLGMDDLKDIAEPDDGGNGGFDIDDSAIPDIPDMSEP